MSIKLTHALSDEWRRWLHSTQVTSHAHQQLHAHKARWTVNQQEYVTTLVSSQRKIIVNNRFRRSQSVDNSCSLTSSWVSRVVYGVMPSACWSHDRSSWWLMVTCATPEPHRKTLVFTVFLKGLKLKGLGSDVCAFLLVERLASNKMTEPHIR